MEGDAGTSQLNLADEPTQEQSIDPSAPDDVSSPHTEESQESAADALDETVEPDDARRSTRIGRGWALGVVVILVVLAALTGVGGYLALKSHAKSESIATAETAAVQAAKECVTATQAPDTASMAASQGKIIACATGDFGAQATLFSGILVEAYQAANAQVAVSDMRAAVEKHYDDGSMDVLVAVRVKVTNSETANQEQGYRLRVRMAPADGTYKIAKLDQVAS
jgi:Mce-associated membrane protein